MDQKRLYPITEEFFNITILPLITELYILKGRPHKVSHYQVFCAILYVLRTVESKGHMGESFQSVSGRF
jgi:hypothetical protein